MYFAGLAALSTLGLLAQTALAAPFQNSIDLFPRTAKDAPFLLENGWQAIADAYKIWVSPAHIIKHNTWTDTIPDACYQQATAIINATEPRLNRPFCPSINALQVFEVWYADAPATPWLFCRCQDSMFSEAEMKDRVGRIPVAVRQRSRYIMSFREGPKNILAWATHARDIIMFGTPGMTTWLHEMGHQFDHGHVYSDADAYHKAVDQDTCWSTEYAKDVNEKEATWSETWAETFIISRLYKIAPQSLPVDISCLKNQVLAVGQQVDGIIEAGYNADAVIPYGPATYRRSALPKRSVNEEPSDIKVTFTTPADFEGGNLVKREADHSFEPEFYTPAEFNE